MKMLVHGVKDTEFGIYHGDTLSNDWGIPIALDPRSDFAYSGHCRPRYT